MPRSGAKSRVDKDRSRSSIQSTPPASQDPEVEDLNRAGLTEAQWTDILIQEDTDETVGEIMEELSRGVTEGCLKAYIRKQLIPFSASWATSYVTQMVEQRLLCLDEGEGPEEASQTEDSEPVPTAPEPWAPGCLPVVIVPPQSASPQEVDTCPIPARTAPRAKQKCNAVDQTPSPPKQSEKDARPRKPLVSKRNKVPSPCPSPKVDQKKKQQMNLPPRPAPSKLLPPLSRPAEQMDVRHKNSRCSVSNHTQGSLPQRKDYQPIPRLDPASLPQNCISPQYKILHTDCTKPNSKKQNAPSKLEQRERKQLPEGPVASPKPPTISKDLSARVQRRKEAGYRSKKSSPPGHSVEGTASAGPLRLDRMELAKGVVLLDPQAVDVFSFKVRSATPSTKLRAIQREEVVPLYSVEEITAGPPPQVIPLFQSKS